jgi:2Fe-2S ferredoxin
MAGTNPYLKAPPPARPTRRYRLTLRNTGETFDVDPDDLDEGYPGQAGSILQTLMRHGVDIEHSCGGVLACSTCHVYVRKGGDATNEPSDEEEDMLDTAPALERSSRLACQCVPDGSEDVEVEIGRAHV